MTVTTEVLLLQPHAPAEVLAWINAELLDKPDALVDTKGWHDSGLHLGNRPGQALDAWVWITYEGDGPTAAQRFVGEDGDGGEEWEDIAAGSMLIHFDTANCWFDTAKPGAQTRDLHAWYIARLARRFGPVWWHDEGAGLWHQLEDAAAPLLHEVRAFSRFGDPNLVEADVLLAA